MGKREKNDPPRGGPLGKKEKERPGEGADPLLELSDGIVTAAE